MLNRKMLFTALAAASIGLSAVPAAAAVDVYIDVAPPAPRYEVVPASRPGYVWQPGHWVWNEHRHVWRKGHWVRERKGYYWHPSRWEQRDGRWFYQRGKWDRQRWNEARWRNPGGDRDRDGVPNARDRDRDGDGVPNRLDARPDNPRRQ